MYFHFSNISDSARLWIIFENGLLISSFTSQEFITVGIFEIYFTNTKPERKFIHGKNKAVYSPIVGLTDLWALFTCTKRCSSLYINSVMFKQNENWPCFDKVLTYLVTYYLAEPISHGRGQIWPQLCGQRVIDYRDSSHFSSTIKPTLLL